MLDNRQPKRFWFLLATLLCGGIVLIAARGKLGLFIHPRYHWFTTILSGIGMVTLLHGAVQYRYTKQTTITFDSYGQLAGIFTHWLLKSGTWFVAIMTVLVLIAPSIPLMSTAAEKKQRPTQSVNEQAIINTAWFNSPETLSEYSQILQTSQADTLITGETVTVSGFISKQSLSETDIFTLSRFVMMCCAVDANPYSIPVYTAGWQDKFAIDQWVEVTGSFERISLGGRQQIVLRPHSTERIEQPNDPYDFYRL